MTRLFGRPTVRPVVVLTYHAVREDEVPRFERQMRDLTDRARAVFADDPSSTNGRQSVAVTFDDAFQSVFERALPILAKHEIPASVFVPTGYLGAEPGWMTGRSNGTGPVVSRSVLATQDGRRVRIGSHTVTHPRLARLDRRQVWTELQTSRQTLEDITGGPVRMLSLPFGSVSAEVVAAAGDAGYERVFANVPLERGTGRSSLLVGRINVSPRDWPIEFRLKIQGAYDWLALAIPVKRTILRWARRPSESS